MRTGPKVFQEPEEAEGSRLSHTWEETYQGGNGDVMPVESSSEPAVEICLCFSHRGVGWSQLGRAVKGRREPRSQGVVEFLVCLNEQTPNPVLVLKAEAEVPGEDSDPGEDGPGQE